MERMLLQHNRMSHSKRVCLQAVGFGYIGGYVVRRFGDLPLATALFAQTHACVADAAETDIAASSLALVAEFEVAWCLFRSAHWEAASVLLAHFLAKYK